MESILGIASLIGFSLLLIGYLLIVIASFRHHFITGIIGMIPVLNLLVIPSTWHRASVGFILGTVGLIIASGTWFAGGDRFVKQQLSLSGEAAVLSNNASEATETKVEATPLINVKEDDEATSQQEDHLQMRKKGVIVPLPEKPLYRLVYETIEKDDLNRLLGDYIRITNKQHAQYEGKLTSLNEQQLVLLVDGNDLTLKQEDINLVEKIVKLKQ